MAAFRLCALFLLLSLTAAAQPHASSGKPSDTLDKDFHRQRREVLRQQLPPRSVAVLFASPVRNRANDVDYYYHPDPDFYYLTGYKEPNAVLLLFQSPQSVNGRQVQEVLFVQPSDELQELWNGKRLGVAGAAKELGITTLANADFAGFKLDTAHLQHILVKELPHDVRDDAADETDLYSLIRQFQHKVNYPADFNATRSMLYSVVRAQGLAQADGVTAYVQESIQRQPDLQSDKNLQAYLQAKDMRSRTQAIAAIPDLKLDAFTLGQLLDEMREVKTAEEIKLLRKAVTMSAVGQVEVMKAMKPGMSEMELQGIHEFVFKKYGAQHVGYPSIVGAGNNGCVLHYIASAKPAVSGQELVLMDVGAEYLGYTADVTRTIPASGKFTKEQKAIYELVLKAQEAGFQQCRVGNAFEAPHQAAQEVIANGLVKLGVIKNRAEAQRYFPHGTSHYLGLDVHDRGSYGPFRANTVITVEPGIYIPEGSPCDKKWWGIGVRIEDDILITEKGWENLSKLAPRTVEEIEKTMAQPSALDGFKLPMLD
ncbi:aminopeptidase P N-terminal domain-containing protein [Pontibacter sp. JH31]|uniref:Xaa-Pro aminopeptidase n=1 Tax=Pontibacter aquaedesilientis TaxID=2766980 RepID=A0ABR7XKZ8_9BACT|nr:aminopeptidase P family protein [Pontibacter aquaedesilientis]MBD1398933.1 aminopeptidase P N-terminal domain-containing protein [Pontibacter aquaedesilientis]